MSSLLAHIAASDILKKQYSLGNEFLYGSILPDIYKKIDKYDRSTTHYIVKTEDGKRLPDLEKFQEDFIIGKEKNILILGYFSHLVQDRIWFSEYVPKYAKLVENGKVEFLKDHTIHEEKDFDYNMYADYACMEEYLVNKYQFNIDDLRQMFKNFNAEEEVKDIIDREIVRHESEKGREVTFVTNEDIDEYIEKCVNECKKYLEKYL